MIWPARQAQAVTAPPPLVLNANNIALRPPQPSDWPQWVDVRARNRDHLTPFEPTWPDDCLTKDFFERRLRKQAQDWRLGLGHAFLVLEKESGALIGGANINNVCRGAAQYATLGYWLDAASQGRGLMREALTLAITYGFTELKLHRFNAACIPGNERSANLLLRLGFTEEGFARNYVQIDGRWQDHRLFGLGIEDWR